jgi:predicted component of type VI protein secretion system
MARQEPTTSLAASAVLVIDGRKHPFRPPRTTLGRWPGNGIVLDDPDADDEHCEVVTNGRVLIVRDLGSTSGTFVNGEPVQQAELQAGDQVQVGSTTIVVEAGGKQPAAPRAPFRLPNLALPAAIGGVLAVAIAIAVAGLAFHRSRGHDARSRYAVAVRTQLAVDPCAIAPGGLAELRGIEDRIAERTVSYAVAPARLGPREVEANLALAALYRERAGSLDRMGDIVWRRASASRQAQTELPRDTLPGGIGPAAARIEQQLAAASGASEELANGLRRSADDSRSFAKLLESASRGGSVAPDDVNRLRVGAAPAAVQQSCLTSIERSLPAARSALAELDRP